MNDEHEYVLVFLKKRLLHAVEVGLRKLMMKSQNRTREAMNTRYEINVFQTAWETSWHLLERMYRAQMHRRGGNKKKKKTSPARLLSHGPQPQIHLGSGLFCCCYRNNRAAGFQEWCLASSACSPSLSLTHFQPAILMFVEPLLPLTC